MEAQEIAVRLGVAVLFGSLIGFERQWLQRMAGLRTNSLVAVGAAGFVVFSTMVSGDNSPTRMAAQVVSADRNDGALEQIIGRISLEPFVTAVHWQAARAAAES